ncbi:MAG: hypothetical protein J6R47_04000 [Acholeplasmatales bacterium]|nr:hypothetical protein [Acholeplasmatales bacterium]
MCLKEDYSNMHAGYNTQIGVINGLITTYLITQSRHDSDYFIFFLDKLFKFYDGNAKFKKTSAKKLSKKLLRLNKNLLITKPKIIINMQIKKAENLEIDYFQNLGFFQPLNIIIEILLH